jgi:hypothetical protein
MKKTALTVLLFAIAIVIISFRVSELDYSLARVSKLNNKHVFSLSEPINQYESVFTFQNLIVNFDCLSPLQVDLAGIENANKESANQSKFYEAIICVNGSARDLAINWTDKSKDNSIARVKKIEGKFVFWQCEPLANYDIVGKYNVSGVGQQVLMGTCPTHQQKIDKLIKKAQKDNLDFDGVIYGSSKYDLVIKFK